MRFFFFLLLLVDLSLWKDRRPFVPEQWYLLPRRVPPAEPAYYSHVGGLVVLDRDKDWPDNLEVVMVLGIHPDEIVSISIANDFIHAVAPVSGKEEHDHIKQRLTKTPLWFKPFERCAVDVVWIYYRWKWSNVCLVQSKVVMVELAIRGKVYQSLLDFELDWVLSSVHSLFVCPCDFPERRKWRKEEKFEFWSVGSYIFGAFLFIARRSVPLAALGSGTFSRKTITARNQYPREYSLSTP
ncbi:uncharacterized protein LOC9635991 isoform X2 [Selaginella moellendorffii]|uniref:uncharacterized protein LOC9635991 isoform X2 n=1 Tax=Selaginella moellendorffii TaxID=88036 RepID=UPI000D1C9DD9|nr:uncharacterized protein LOC9635991 isoform X2 [Selaginella moellendorffii]|eukprot:XP_024526099.1 uncharacterized protein LOC9635991 isoform X2 [Selaginella moellendorffii]